MKLIWLPNAITILRMVMIVPLAWLLLTDHFVVALWLALAAGISDALDGLLAKLFKLQTTMGGILDPIADKLFLLSTVCVLYAIDVLPFWLTLIIVLRDVVILAGAFFWWRLLGMFIAEPSWLGKFTTLFQIAMVLFALFDLANYFSADNYLPLMQLAVLLLTVFSGVDYIVRYSIKAKSLLDAKQ